MLYSEDRTEEQCVQCKQSATLKLNVTACVLNVWVQFSPWNTCFSPKQTLCSSWNGWIDKFVGKFAVKSEMLRLEMGPDLSLYYRMLSNLVSWVRLSFKVSVRRTKDDRVVTKINSVTRCQRREDTLCLHLSWFYFLFLLTFIDKCSSFTFFTWDVFFCAHNRRLSGDIPSELHAHYIWIHSY